MKFPVYSLLCQRSEVKGQRAEIRFRPQSTTSPRCGASGLLASDVAVYSPQSAFGGLRSLVYRPQSTTSPRCGASGHLASDVAAHSLQSASAFTLVELIVVVAIISILLMLLIPNIRTMREKAWSSQCQNNLRQYGIAMNQYMADYSGYFIYPGLGVGGAIARPTLTGSDIGDFGIYDNRPVRGATVGGAAADYWEHFIWAYVDANVTLASLSAGEASVRVCPVVLRALHSANYFDPRSPDFKGYGPYYDDTIGEYIELGDFETVSGSGYDKDGNVLPATYLDSSFTTYAINREMYRHNKKDIPENVIAFIDWNARDGWWANLSYTNWMFNGTNSEGVAVVQDTSKQADGAWWLTEVGFHHLMGNEYGANYVAMDGHVGWIGSNAISRASFTNAISVN